MSNVDWYPEVYISIPAHAIINALSVHKLGGGKATLIWE